MNIAISGSSGFVGSNLVPYLTNTNNNIISVSRKATGKKIKTYEDSSLWQGNEAFIHLAGKAHDLKKTSDDAEYFQVNTELTKKIFDQFLESDSEVFIFMSSVKAAADVVVTELTEEETPNPVTAYGKSKLAAENYILEAELPKNKRVYILRPCMIHGPNNKGNLNLLYGFVNKGLPYPFGKYENQRSFVSVSNLCFIVNELLINKNIPSGIYNLADDDALSTKELVSVIGEVLNKPAKIINFPKGLMQLLASIGGVLKLPINNERLQKLTENYVVSNKKIKSVLSKDLPLSTKEGIKKTIQSFI